VALTGTAKRG